MKHSPVVRVVAGVALAASMLVVPSVTPATAAGPAGAIRQGDASSVDDELQPFAEMTTNETVVPLSPARFADTRATGETFDGAVEGTGRLAGGGLLQATIGGRGAVPADADGVVVNVTAVRPEVRGYLTIYACGADRPLASSVNFVPGANVGNELVAGLSAMGALCVFASSPIDVTIDVVGFIPTGSSLSPVVPSRLLDTRVDGVTIDGAGQAAGLTTPGTTTPDQGMLVVSPEPVEGHGD